MIDFASIKDKKELHSLWQMTFLEDSQVIENFFENVFSSVVTPTIKVNGEIVSSLFLLDCNIGRYKGKCVYCAMTKYSERGKGYMKKLLDFSYNYCLDNGFDFLFLVPAEESLFEYYKKCGFENFGIHRKHLFNGDIPITKEKLKFDYTIEFEKSVYEYWENSCLIYGGEICDFGLCFDDDNKIIRNADCNYADIPEKHKKDGNIIQGNIDFGEEYSPAMIKTENNDIKDLCCYIGITLE
ncbi:MAG: GNAT family N-acetyltransferase [Clostridia bacterium]|nr:GNAT family N-acetyltransferase [Clostridia bacterium]